MADETERSAPTGHGERGDPAALALALGGAGTLDPRAAAYLEEQIKVARAQERVLHLQAEDLRREDKLRHWSLVVHHVSDVMKVTFELTVAAVALGILVAIGAAVWSAAHDNSLVIDAFSVPPDMAARGVTGQVVAAQLQDKLAAMQDATGSARPAASYSNNWGNDIKVEIPNTGISVGEFYRYLASWLGHQTHISGEVFRTADGIAVTVRAVGAGTTVRGSEAGLDTLLQQSAEQIYRRTQPYRYTVYLLFDTPPRIASARAIEQNLTVAGAPLDRVWAHIGLGTMDDFAGDFQRARDERQKAAALAPDLALSYSDMDADDITLGHDEMALADARTAIRLERENTDADMSSRARTMFVLVDQANFAFEQSDFDSALQFNEELAPMPEYSGVVEGADESIVVDLALLHRDASARQAWRDLPPTSDIAVLGGRAQTDAEINFWMGDWPALLARRADIEKVIEQSVKAPGASQMLADTLLTRGVWPYVAVAMAMTGDFKNARSLIDKTPLDCYVCLRNRGEIDAAARNWNGAAYWFARAAGQAPSIALAYYEWGRLLMEKGDTDGAIAKFKLANDKGPHFADPLEMWGEALMQENRSDLALAKFEEADKYAPNWGRLHLKWGEALSYTGRKGEAKAQFALAAVLDLSAADKAELARAAHG